jgi:hypothetical protein
MDFSAQLCEGEINKERILEQVFEKTMRTRIKFLNTFLGVFNFQRLIFPLGLAKFPRSSSVVSQ